MIGYRRGILASGETLADDGKNLTLSMPVRARFRGGRAAVLRPPGIPRGAPRPDMALVKAIARAHHWRQMLLDGEVTSIDALARRVKQDRGYVGLTLNLAFLKSRPDAGDSSGRAAAGSAPHPSSGRESPAILERAGSLDHVSRKRPPGRLVHCPGGWPDRERKSTRSHQFRM